MQVELASSTSASRRPRIRKYVYLGLTCLKHAFTVLWPPREGEVRFTGLYGGVYGFAEGAKLARASRSRM